MHAVQTKDTNLSILSYYTVLCQHFAREHSGFFHFGMFEGYTLNATDTTKISKPHYTSFLSYEDVTILKAFDT